MCQGEFIDFFAELTGFGAELSEFSLSLFQTVLSKQYSARFLYGGGFNERGQKTTLLTFSLLISKDLWLLLAFTSDRNIFSAYLLQRKTKGQQLKGKIVSEISHFFTHFQKFPSLVRKEEVCLARPKAKAQTLNFPRDPRERVSLTILKWEPTPQGRGEGLAASPGLPSPC